MRLILFDIDGTLIHSKGLGMQTVRYGLESVFGTSGAIDTYPLGGKIDRQIVVELMTDAGIPAAEIEEKLPQVFEHMIDKGQELFQAHNGLGACRGVSSLLGRLQQEKGVMVGLLTGNIEPTAKLKLAGAGIAPQQFWCGAYGSDGRVRNELPAIAMKRASEVGNYPFTGENTVIIGDTPADIQCAYAGKATAIAVATGRYTSSELASHKPHYLFEDLADMDTLLPVLLP